MSRNTVAHHRTQFNDEVGRAGLSLRAPWLALRPKSPKSQSCPQQGGDSAIPLGKQVEVRRMRRAVARRRRTVVPGVAIFSALCGRLSVVVLDPLIEGLLGDLQIRERRSIAEELSTQTAVQPLDHACRGR